jgi:hypothetical protein
MCSEDGMLKNATVLIGRGLAGDLGCWARLTLAAAAIRLEYMIPFNMIQILVIDFTHGRVCVDWRVGARAMPFGQEKGSDDITIV